MYPLNARAPQATTTDNFPGYFDSTEIYSETSSSTGTSSNDNNAANPKRITKQVTLLNITSNEQELTPVPPPAPPSSPVSSDDNSLASDTETHALPTFSNNEEIHYKEAYSEEKINLVSLKWLGIKLYPQKKKRHLTIIQPTLIKYRRKDPRISHCNVAILAAKRILL